MAIGLSFEWEPQTPKIKNMIQSDDERNRCLTKFVNHFGLNLANTSMINGKPINSYEISMSAGEDGCIRVDILEKHINFSRLLFYIPLLLIRGITPPFFWVNKKQRLDKLLCFVETMVQSEINIEDGIVEKPPF